MKVTFYNFLFFFFSFQQANIKIFVLTGDKQGINKIYLHKNIQCKIFFYFLKTDEMRFGKCQL